MFLLSGILTKFNIYYPLILYFLLELQTRMETTGGT